MLELIQTVWDIFVHIDVHLNAWAGAMGPWLYVLLFAIIFCETGLVVTPFLPGDSLLFAIGALSTRSGSPIELWLMAVLLCAAAVGGDAVNYSIGKWVGPKVFSKERSRWLNRKHLERAQRFYERHGGKTIILARFVPIIRTFAPFVAGIGRMRYLRFASFNVTGGVAWVLAFLLAGFFFADLPVVKDQFHIVIAVIILISMIPIAVEFWRARRESRRAAAGAGPRAGA
ncbi:MAG TPA: DedA family protein [Myxococcota bacterium]|nr:DedA family protein [Myxococcota bacterium]HRY97325.1 DedA family protein [Myxococcota bacterium]HSA22457.1 DedA family protein [Myxococcota bacterium]